MAKTRENTLEMEREFSETESAYNRVILHKYLLQNFYFNTNISSDLYAKKLIFL